MSDLQNKKRDYFDIFFHCLQFSWIAAQEIGTGIIKNRVPDRFTAPGVLLAIVLLFNTDAYVLTKIGFHSPIGDGFRQFLIYISVLSGWVTWGCIRAAQRSRLLNKLKGAFKSADLKCNGRYPSLLEDIAIDAHVRRLKLLCNGVKKSDFEKAAEQIEAVLNFSIVQIVQNECDKSKIEIIYTMKDIDRLAVLEHPERFADAEIPIGISFEGPVQINMRDVGHILVAGQTGGGKSNFLKLATSVLVQNNPQAKAYFLDFKGGMEGADLKSHVEALGNRIEYSDGTKKCVEELSRIGMELDGRFQALTEVGATNFDDYLKKKLAKGQDSTNAARVGIEKRTFVIIDEIAQLYSREPDVDKETVKDARAAVNRIARQGRAAGVHLIVATQKPDASSFDQTVKANLPGVLCFPMTNQVSSVSAIGTKRAFELNPKVKGRAVWKFGPKLEEVQTYFFG